MLKPSLQLRLGQQLTMTPQLQQAIRLLQLPALELQQQVREALEQNVMLEPEDELEGESVAVAEPEPESVAPPPEEAIESSATAPDEPSVEIADETWDSGPGVAAESSWSGEDERQEFSDQRGETLKEHLLWQLELARLDERARATGRALIDAINDDGYLQGSLQDVVEVLKPELDVTIEEVEAVLGHIQGFDPLGVGARSVGECIGLQLAALDPDTPGLAAARAIAARHLDLVATQQRPLLKRELRLDEDGLETALTLLKSCHPRPGSTIQPLEPDYIVPDVFVRRGEHGWLVELNAQALPRVRLNQGYASLVSRGPGHAALRAQLQEARWLLRSLEIRNDTLLKVARCIVQRQTAFFARGDEAMQPMVLRDVAEAVEMHESTISRVTTSKYMHTPRGVFEFRHFFSSHVSGSDGSEMSSTAIRARIRKLIAAEDPRGPLSDSRIAELLGCGGARVARRTVAKYREAMNIAPSSERRRMHR